ncbi:MAG: M1 family metallopeptidase [Flavobacteriales bacterium]|nr:M1 family metallopeptidase [Flavobacteriales bacterium]
MNRIFPFALALPSALAAQDYFQQQVDYTISVRLDDERHLLHAQESFVYANNSPQALDTLWMHLWPNAYRDRETALCEQLDRMDDLSLHFAEEDDRGYIDSLDFRSGDTPLIWGYHARHADIAWIKLPLPLQSGSSISISTPFRVKVPDGKFSRLGHTKQAYYITQWYPKPAVFDATGWHAMPYLTEGEFYSEFGSFDVSITLPSNYVVGATGILQEESERSWMDSLASVPYSETQQLHLGKQRSGLNVFPASASTTKTIRYKQGRVHDFGWFADKRFIVRKSSVALPATGRDVTTWVMYTPKNALTWEGAVEYVNESVRLYSKWVGDYPYTAATAIDGTISAGGGMEYRMITIIGNMDSKESLDNVIAHEVGHNWFYGILGSNERDHAWMDEGMNSFVELRYMRERYPHSGLSIDIPGLRKMTEGITDAHRYQSEMGYRLNARRNLDQPLSLTSNDFTMVNYGTGVYMKTALIMDHLMAYLGEETMDRCLHAYFEEWKFKHPRPEDMRKVFERESRQKLAWVFDDFLRTDLKVDIKARNLRMSETDQRARVTVTTSGETPIPVPVTGYSGQDSVGTEWIMAEPSWMNPTWELTKMNPDRVRIDAGNRTLDIDRRNNEVRAHGLLKRCKAPKFESFAGLERNDRRSIYYALLPAWNGHDGWQAGLALRNTTFPSQRTEWMLAPLYAFGSERMVGGARIEHHFDRMRSSVFQNIHLGLSARTSGTFHDHDAVAWYEKYSPSIRFDLKRDPLTRPWSHSIALRGVRIYRTSEIAYDSDVIYRYRTYDDYLELKHVMEDARKLHPSTIATALTVGEDWLRGSLEIKQAFAYNERNKQFRIRAFAGSFLYKGGDHLTNGLDAWSLTWGPEDMLYDHAYFERGADKGFTSRQFNKQQGAFKTPFRQGGSDTWIASINAELDMPFKLPIAIFGSAGWVPITTVTQEGKSTSTATYFEAGIGMPVIKDVLEIWFPLYVSERIADEEEFLDRVVSDRVRFVIALEKLDPTRIVRGIRP